MIFNRERLLLLITIIEIILATGLAYADPIEIPSLFFSLKIEGEPSIVSFEKGKVLYKLSAYKEAIRAFSQIAMNAPQDIIEESLYLKANSFMKIGDYVDAMTSVNLIPDKSRFYIYGLYTRAMISLNIKREDDAIDYLDQVSRNLPSSQAIKDKEKSLIEGLALKAHLTLGYIYLESGNPSEAIKHFFIIPRESPFYEQALFGSGWAYASMDRWVRAVIFWEELSYLYPESKYTREVMPYIGYAYTILSAYGKALEQNGIALHYYGNMLKKISEIEKEIKGKDVKTIVRAIEIIGDKELSDEIDLYYGLLSMEDHLIGIRKGVIDADAVINASMERRSKIIDALSERLTRRIEDFKRKLSEASVNTTLEIARNLRLEGGGRINNDMIFNGP